MDISGLSNTYDINAKMMLQEQQNKISGFQTTIEAAQKSKDKAQMMDACKEFESYFIQQIFKQMRSTVDESARDSFIKKSQSEKYFQEMLDEQYAKMSTETGGIGLANFLYKQMLRNSGTEEA